MKFGSRLTSELLESLQIDEPAVRRLDRFCALVLDANRRINLISRGGDQPLEVDRQLRLSVSTLPLIPAGDQCTWLDIGSGGGFPAIPIAICRRGFGFTLAESVAKKAFFLERTVEALGLGNISIANIRVSPGTNDFGKRFDWVSVKAVADWEQTLEWGAKFLHPGGYLLTYKTESPDARASAVILRSRFKLIDEKHLTDNSDDSNARIMLLHFQPHTTDL